MTATPGLATGTYEIPIAQITVGRRHRVHPDVSELRQSIARVGLLHPITVSVDGQLAAGAARLQAHKDLGLETIRANVRELTPEEAELIEIDENLFDRGLTVLEEGLHLLRRRELVELVRLHLSPVRVFHGETSFTPLEVETLHGMSRTTAWRRMDVCAGIAPDVADRIALTAVANSPKDLAELSAMSHEEQREVATALVDDDLRTIRQAVRKLHPERVEPEPSDWTRETAEHLYTVTASITLTFAVPNASMRMRGDKVAAKESEQAEHVITRTWGVDVRERGIEGLRAIGGDLFRDLYADEALRADWVRIPSAKQD